MIGGFSRTNLPVQRYLALLVLPWGAMLLLAVAVLWPYLAWFRDTVESLQDEQLPGVLETQRTRTNLNVLRKQLAIIYLAEAPAERRRARLQAQALLAGMAHDPSPVAPAAVGMGPRVRQLYDACMAADRALSVLHRSEMELMLAVSRLEQVSGQQLAGAMIFSHTGKDGVRHGREAYEEMRRLLAPATALCAGATGGGACEVYGQSWRSLSAAWEARLAANERAHALWQEQENELLRLINVISSRELQRSLEEAESLSEATDYIVWSVFVFTLGLLAFLLVLVLLLRRDLLRPLVGIAGNLSRLRDGQQPEPIAPVRIAELQVVADIVPDLGGYLGSLKEHSSRLEEEKAAYSRMSLMDSLTAIPNRRAFDLRLADLADRRRPVSLIMLDVDMFKVYNDTLGHQEGDACLRRVAQTMRDCLRGGDREIFRYGGEEFAVVLEDVPREAALQVAERLRRAVERLALPHPGNPQTGLVTISLGVAAAPELTADALLRLLEAADHALYAAKKQGRNRVAGAAEGVRAAGEDGAAPAGAGTEKSACLAPHDRL